ANRRSQAPPTAAAAVKGQSTVKPTAAAVVAGPTSTAPTSGSPASSIRFGSIDEPENGSTIATASETAPAAQAASTGMRFGSIPASQMMSKPEETPVVPTPVAVSQEPILPVSHAPEHVNSNTYRPPHVPQQHVQHGHHSHRRTDSASSDSAHYRPPAVSQAPMIPNMGPGQYVSRAPTKNHGMASMNPQAPIHAMHQQHHQQPWQMPQQYYPPYNEHGHLYQAPMYPQQPMYVTQQQQRRPVYTPSQPAFNPPAPAPSKKIVIKDPKGNEIQFPSFTSAADVKAPAAPSTVELKKPEEDKVEIIKPSSTKSAIPIVKPEEKERERKEKEEKERKEKEEKERQEREAKERAEKEAKEAEERRIREEQAEKERIEAEARAEQERKEKEERELKEKEERERKEKEERERKEQEERERKEREERERLELQEKERVEKERAEAERKRKEEEERIAREKAEAEKSEQEAKDKLEAERREKEKLEAPKNEDEKKTETPAAPVSKPTGLPDSIKSGLSVDISRTISAPSSTHSARIENFNAVSYPSHIQSPGNADGQGKFRYDRDFLMQFMNVCVDKPDSLPSLDVLGGDGANHNMQSPGGARGGARGAMGGGRPKPTQPMGSFNLGSMKLNNGGGMPMGMRNPSTDGRLHRTNSDNNFLPRNNNLSRPPSQRESRGGKRGGGQGRGGDRGHQEPALTIPLADIVPLEKTENAWTPNVNASQAPVVINADEPVDQEVVARKVKGLLNKLTLEKFDSISDKVVDIANLSSKETDGTTLKHCIQIIFEKATDEPNFGSVYAMLCQKLMEKISPEVKDVTVDGTSGTGGKLFRKYLLHRCQEDFMRGWKDKASAGGASLNDKDGPDLMSDEYYILMKAKRQGLGLIHFIGELFKLNMLTEKIMHECVKKLLANVKDPEEEETEGLCKLMTTVGLQLDRPEAKNHMDVYFVRMTELTKNNKLPSRIRFMVQDVIELRANKWVNRRAAAGPKTIAAIHEEAARQQEEKEMMRRTASSGGGRGLPNRREQMGRVASYRGSGDARHDMGGVPQVGADGWSTVPGGPVMTKKAGDLSSFGNTSRSKVNGPPSLGPSQSVFGSLNKGRRAGDKAATQVEANRQLSSTNIFAALEGDGGDRRSSVDNEKPMERKKLNLAPRTVPIVGTDNAAAKESKAETDGAPKKTEDEAKRSIENTLKEYLSLKDMNELLISVKELDACYRPLFVTEFVNQSMEMKQSDVDSIAEIFKKLNGENILSSEDFESGFADPIEFLPDTAIDVPNAYKYAAQLLEAAGMDPAKAAKP
ncbi:hypothetical protein BGZ49_002698, partial [Haplosporangium sp. Z 27]